MEFIKKTQNRYGLSEQSAILLAENLESVHYARKRVVIGEGERDIYTYFVESGSVRNYVSREDKCVILSFAFEGDAASSLLGVGALLSRYTMETMEKTTLLRVPRERLESLFAESVELANLGRRVMERALLAHEAYFADYCWMEKGEQYLRMLREYPALLQRIPLKDLAAYLLVTPQTLSRIRANSNFNRVDRLR